MNFSFLENKAGLETFHSYCNAAESLALSDPDVSITAARMAMEYMLKLLYGAAISPEIEGMTAYDMLTDYDLIRYLDDRTLMDAFHFIRKAGNKAAHHGKQNTDSALAVLEKLHFLAGETAIVLGAATDYPPFAAEALQEQKPSAASMPMPQESGEPQVENRVIQRFTGVLHSAASYSMLRFPKGQLVDTFVSGRKTAAAKKADSSVKGIDTANNSRYAYRELMEWFIAKAGAENITFDAAQQLIVLHTGSQSTVIAVKTGACRLAVKNAQGEWDYMPGIDYVLYTPKVTGEMPILKQFRVYAANELVQMWQDAKLIRIAVPSGVAKKLKQILGPDARISIQEYGTEMTAQVLYTAKQAKQQMVFERHDSMPLLEEGGYEKLLPPALKEV